MEKLIEDLIRFKWNRELKRFHTPENLSKSISIEVAEQFEHFQWGMPMIG